MANAFQSNAFQQNAFQEASGGFTGGSGQAQCDVKQTYNGHGQAQCDIKAISYAHGQAQCDVKAVGYGSGQAQCTIQAIAFGQAQADIKQVEYGFGQAQCDIKQTYSQCGQAQCLIGAIGRGFGQAQCDVKAQGYGSGQAQCDVKAIISSCGQAQCYVPTSGEQTCIEDDFDRTESGTWGTGNIGEWTSQNANGIDSVDGTYGIIDWLELGFGDLFQAAISHTTPVPEPAISADVIEAQIDFYWADATGGTPFSRTLNFFLSEDIDNQTQTTGGYLDALNGTIAGAWFSDPDSDDDVQPITVDLSALGHLKFQYDRVAGTIKAKYWENADAEPDWLSTATGSTVDLGATPVFWVAPNSLQSAPSGLTTSTPMMVDTINLCYSASEAITAGYGQAQALICATVLYDSFSRISSGNPGTPDVGEDWVDSAASEYSNITTDGANLILAGNVDYDFVELMNPTVWSNGEASIDFNIDERRDWATVFQISPHAPDVDSFGFLQVYSYYDPDENKTFVWLQIPSPFSNESVEISDYTPDTWYRAKIQIAGDQIGVKIWDLSGPEPEDWLISASIDVNVFGVTYFFADVGEAGSYPSALLFDNTYICSTDVVIRHHSSGQAQAFIRASKKQCGQAQADIKRTQRGFGQAQCRIVLTQGYGQAQARIKGFPTRSAQAQALILKWAGYGQCQASIRRTFQSYFQAQCLINRSYAGAQANADIKRTQRGFGQAQCYIGDRPRGFGQAQCYIISYRSYQSAQATALINSNIHQGWAQAQCYVYNIPTGQAQALIRKTVVKSAQAQAMILRFVAGTGQAQALISNHRGFGQAQCLLVNSQGFGQAQCSIKLKQYGSGQAQCLVNGFRGFGQAQCSVKKGMASGQAQGFISQPIRNYGQARTYIRVSVVHGQAQCRVIGPGVGIGLAIARIRPRMGQGQAQAYISTKKGGFGQAQCFTNNGSRSGQAQASINSPVYGIKYNGRFLPGYAQTEAFESPMEIYNSEAAYLDLKFSEYTGLQNKIISLTVKSWKNNDFAASKTEVELATTILRSNRGGFVPLYIKDMSKHYLAMVKKITTDNAVETSVRTYNYQVEFEAKPWLLSDTTNIITGSGSINTSPRTIRNGGWTPARLVLSGTDITVSGYTETGQFTGFISVSGVVNNLEINSEAYTATIAGVNKNELMRNLDYALYVGPGQTFFDVEGADSITIEWEDRFYL